MNKGKHSKKDRITMRDWERLNKSMSETVTGEAPPVYFMKTEFSREDERHYPCKGFRKY